MANEIIDISAELKAILEAVYGEQVRSAIHNALQKTATECNTGLNNLPPLEEGIRDLKEVLNFDKTAAPGYIMTSTNDGTGQKWSPVGLPTDEQTAEAVSGWLNDHPEATTTVQDGSLTESKFSSILKAQAIKDYVTPELFGAVGNGVYNDYNAFKACAEYAEREGVDIVVPRKSYYLNGGQSIELRSNVKCLGSTFIVGDNHKKTSNPLFVYSHDTEIAAVQGVVSDFLVSNYEVSPNYKNKFFILDTGISYGSPIAQEAPSNETIKETICTNDNQTYIYYDKVSDHLSDAATLLHVSDLFEIGYTFSGAIIKQKNESGYGVCFLLINRNNIHVCDVQIEANNALGEGSVFNCQYCANVSFDNVSSYSEQPASWEYEIVATYCANLLINNFKGYNQWSSIATRGLKNYTLSNSIAATFDCHWNAFGKFICDNNILYKDAHIGYGKGTFIVKNTVCAFVSTRIDYQQIWAGQIVVNDTITNDGIRIQIGDSSATDYDGFFDDFILPKVHINNVKTDERILYLRIPDNISTRLVKNRLIIENCEFENISVPYNNIGYDAILSNVPFATGTRSALKRGANIVRDELYSQVVELTIPKLTSPVATISKSGNVVCVNVSGMLNEAVAAWGSLVTIPVGYRPGRYVYGVAMYGTTPITINISTSGSISAIQALSETDKRLSFSIAYTV